MISWPNTNIIRWTPNSTLMRRVHVIVPCVTSAVRVLPPAALAPLVSRCTLIFVSFYHSAFMISAGLFKSETLSLMVPSIRLVYARASCLITDNVSLSTLRSCFSSFCMLQLCHLRRQISLSSVYWLFTYNAGMRALVFRGCWCVCGCACVSATVYASSTSRSVLGLCADWI